MNKTGTNSRSTYGHDGFEEAIPVITNILYEHRRRQTTAVAVERSQQKQKNCISPTSRVAFTTGSFCAALNQFVYFRYFCAALCSHCITVKRVKACALIGCWSSCIMGHHHDNDDKSEPRGNDIRHFPRCWTHKEQWENGKMTSGRVKRRSPTLT